MAFRITGLSPEPFAHLFGLPDAAHHVMVDDPLGVIDAIRDGLPKLT